MTPEPEKAYQQALTEALQKGHDILKNGGKALDATEAVVPKVER